MLQLVLQGLNPLFNPLIWFMWWSKSLRRRLCPIVSWGAWKINKNWAAHAASETAVIILYCRDFRVRVQDPDSRKFWQLRNGAVIDMGGGLRGLNPILSLKLVKKGMLIRRKKRELLMFQLRLHLLLTTDLKIVNNTLADSSLQWLSIEITCTAVRCLGKKFIRQQVNTAFPRKKHVESEFRSQVFYMNGSKREACNSTLELPHAWQQE